MRLPTARLWATLWLVAGCGTFVPHPEAVASSTSSASPTSPAQSPFLTAAERERDVAQFCAFVRLEYAYFRTPATDWDLVCAHTRQAGREATSRAEFVRVLEHALDTLHDPHAHLGTHLADSPRLVPSQTDLLGVWEPGREGSARVLAVRAGSGAAAAGLEAGQEIVLIQGETVETAVRQALPTFARAAATPRARDWALQRALAGRHNQLSMTLQVRTAAGARILTWSLQRPPAKALLSASTVGGVTRIRIHDALGHSDLISAFDRALDQALAHAPDKLGDSAALVLDLRDTPSGGNTQVARGLMGRFVKQVMPYQQHEWPREERETGIRRIWTEWVAPRSPVFAAPVVVLVGPWTGSMGEGVAIGLNAAIQAPVVGAPMARLQGALSEIKLAASGIVVRVPGEKLFHINGTAREDFVSQKIPADSYLGEDDPALAWAITLARQRR